MRSGAALPVGWLLVLLPRKNEWRWHHRKTKHVDVAFVVICQELKWDLNFIQASLTSLSGQLEFRHQPGVVGNARSSSCPSILQCL